MGEPDPKIIAAIGFYLQHYAWIKCLVLRPGERIVLGDKKNQVCRFCGRSAATVPFQRQAHAIPESLGNKASSLITSAIAAINLSEMALRTILATGRSPTERSPVSAARREYLP